MKSTITNKSKKDNNTTVQDSRFSEVYSDPRFMSVPKKLKKVQIDDRFKKALKSKEFNLVQKVDKYGRKVDRQDNTMAKFYQIEGTEEGTSKTANKYYDEEGKFKWEAQSSSEEEDEIDEDADDEES